jgi:hypothetical protein
MSCLNAIMTGGFVWQAPKTDHLISFSKLSGPNGFCIDVAGSQSQLVHLTELIKGFIHGARRANINQEFEGHKTT